MTAESKTVIKSYFETGDKPTQGQFANLIDSYADYNSLVLAARDFEIWVYTGQSNMTQHEAGGDTTVNPKAKVWNGTAPVTAEIGVAPFSDPTKNCIAIQAARQQQVLTNKTIYMIWVAQGSQSISHWLPGTGAPDMYADIKTQVEALLVYLGLTTSDPINGVMWLQGESDDTDTELFGYYDNLTQVIERFQAETWGPYIQFIAGLLANNQDDDMANCGLRLAAYLGNIGAFKLVNSEFQPTADGVHFTGISCTAIGKDMAYTASGLADYKPNPKINRAMVLTDLTSYFADLSALFSWVEDVEFSRLCSLTVTLPTGGVTLTKALLSLVPHGAKIILKSSFINGKTAPPVYSDFTGVAVTDIAMVKTFYDSWIECDGVNGFVWSGANLVLDTTALIGDGTNTAIGFDGQDSVQRLGKGTLVYRDLTVIGFNGTSGKGIRINEGSLKELNTSSKLVVAHCVNGIEAFGSQIIGNNVLSCYNSGYGIYGEMSNIDIPSCIIRNNTLRGIYSEKGTKVNAASAVVSSNGTDCFVGTLGSQIYVQGATYSTANVSASTNVAGNSVLDGNMVHTTGTWTPVLFGSTSAGSPVYAVQTGDYFRNGNLIVGRGTITITNKGGIGGNVRVTTPVSATSGYDGTVSIGLASNFTLASANNIGGRVVQNQAYIQLLRCNNTGNDTNVTDTQIADNFSCNFTMIYRTG